MSPGCCQLSLQSNTAYRGRSLKLRSRICCSSHAWAMAIALRVWTCGKSRMFRSVNKSANSESVPSQLSPLALPNHNCSSCTTTLRTSLPNNTSLMENEHYESFGRGRAHTSESYLCHPLAPTKLSNLPAWTATMTYEREVLRATTCAALGYRSLSSSIDMNCIMSMAEALNSRFEEVVNMLASSSDTLMPIEDRHDEHAGCRLHETHQQLIRLNLSGNTDCFANLSGGDCRLQTFLASTCKVSWSKACSRNAALRVLLRCDQRWPLSVGG